MIKEFENEFRELIKDIDLDEIDETLTEEDIRMLGYDSLDDFWESNI